MLNESISMYLRLRFELKIRKDVEKKRFLNKFLKKCRALLAAGPHCSVGSGGLSFATCAS